MTWDRSRIEELLQAPVELAVVLPMNGFGHMSKRPTLVHVRNLRTIQRGRKVCKINERLCTTGRVNRWGSTESQIVTCPACVRTLENQLKLKRAA